MEQQEMRKQLEAMYEQARQIYFKAEPRLEEQEKYVNAEQLSDGELLYYVSLLTHASIEKIQEINTLKDSMKGSIIADQQDVIATPELEEQEITNPQENASDSIITEEKDIIASPQSEEIELYKEPIEAAAATDEIASEPIMEASIESVVDEPIQEPVQDMASTIDTPEPELVLESVADSASDRLSQLDPEAIKFKQAEEARIEIMRQQNESW